MSGLVVHLSGPASAGCWRVAGRLLVDCWLVAGWLLVCCWLVAGLLLVGFWLVAGWLPPAGEVDHAVSPPKTSSRPEAGNDQFADVLAYGKRQSGIAPSFLASAGQLRAGLTPLLSIEYGFTGLITAI